MAAELPQPGVEIVEQFRSVTPTILTPTLVPCVVGVAKQIVDLLVDNGSGSQVLNTDAIVTTHGALVAIPGSGDPIVYGGLDGLDLVLSIDNGPDIEITFSDAAAAGLTPSDVVAQVNAQFTTSGVTAALAETVGDDHFQIRTIGTGEDQFVDVVSSSDAAVLSAFGIGVRRYAGISSYNNRTVNIPLASFPDPRGNLSELEVEADSIRVFVGLGNKGFRESSRVSAFLRKGTASTIAALDEGSGDNLSRLLRFPGQDFTASPTAAVVTGSGGTYPLVADVVLILNDGQQNQAIQLASGDALADVVTKVNDTMGTAVGGLLTAATATGELRLTHSISGTDSIIDIVGGSAVTALGLTTGVTYASAVSLPKPGDSLWVEGVHIGDISEVAPSGTVTDLKVSKRVVVSSNIGTNFYIVANHLPDLDATRPVPDLVVGSVEDITLKQEQLRNSPQGAAITAAGPIYVEYAAVRKDVTALAANPGLLRFDNTTQLTQALAPINSDNPLALGLFFALLNGPGIQVTGLGVDAADATSPFGTLEAFERAADYLQAFEVYAIAPLSHDAPVHQAFLAHAIEMSAPTMKGERVVIVNPSLPTHKLDALVATGVNGGTVASSSTEFDTKVINLTALIQAAGIDTSGTIDVADGLFLDIGSNTLNYSISDVSGSVVTVRTQTSDFTAGENADNFYATSNLSAPPLPSALIDEAFAIKVRGAALVTAAGRDLDATAAAVAGTGRAYGNRRLWMTIPDKCAATVGGIEQKLDAFYVNAAIAGMVGQNPPQQSFTNFPIAGFTRIIGSNDTFNTHQMNAMAGGGAWIIIQDVIGAPLTSRMALTTDMTSVETRTDSITKVVDYTAKFLRSSLRNFIGRFNINQGFLDSLASVIQGVLGLLVETGVLVGATLNNIIQDENNPDTVLIDILLDVPFPANYLRLTLVV